MQSISASEVGNISKKFPHYTKFGDSIASLTQKAMLCARLRFRVIEFLIQSAQLLEVSPIVKYSALSLFVERFYPALSRFRDDKVTKNWLLHPIRESNLQLFALVSIWLSSKIHETTPLSVAVLKSFGDEFIKEQHYTKRDLLDASLQEMVLMQVLKFEIGTSHTAFIIINELLSQLKVIAQVGEHVNFEACMDILDLLYEKEVTSVLFNSPCSLAASILVVAYVISVPTQRWEFPILPWVKFVTSYKEEEILYCVRDILKHIFEPQVDQGDQR